MASSFSDLIQYSWLLAVIGLAVILLAWGITWIGFVIGRVLKPWQESVLVTELSLK